MWITHWSKTDDHLKRDERAALLAAALREREENEETQELKSLAHDLALLEGMNEMLLKSLQ